MIIAVDFDGTICEHLGTFPDVGPIIPGVLPILEQLVADKNKLMLWTMRDQSNLRLALQVLHTYNLNFWGINENLTQKSWSTQTKKQYAHVYIDDAALGCPLVYPPNRRPYVDWQEVAEWLHKRDIITENPLNPINHNKI